MFPKSPGCRPCRHDTQCRCTRLCCVPFRFADMMIYLGCTPSGMRIATGKRPRSPQPRHGDLPEEPPYGVPPLWCACHRGPFTIRYGDAPRPAAVCIPPLWRSWHNDRIAHRNGDMPWAYSRWYGSFGVRSIILPAIDRLPDGAGEFPPNLPAAARVAMTRNAAALAFAACPSVSPT